MRVQDLDTPALLVHRPRLVANVNAMAALAGRHGVALRPHVKTHKSAAIARLQLQAGATGITCAKVGEAEVMVRHGVTDIVVAQLVISPLKLRRLLALAPQCRVSAIVDSEAGARAAAAVCTAVGRPLAVLIKIDSGLHRCGVAPGRDAVALAGLVSQMPALRLAGILTHAGHAYAATDPAERERIGRYEGEAMAATAALLAAAGLAPGTVSVGSTPTVKFAAAVPGVTEIRPGNYVFYDRTQVALGVAEPEQCALTVLAQVISAAPGRAVIDAGSKMLSLDLGAHGRAAVTGYGAVRDRPDLVLQRLSEEHGILAVSPGVAAPAVGDRVEIVPNHACAVVNNFDRMWVTDGERVLDCWPIDARGPVT